MFVYEVMYKVSVCVVRAAVELNDFNECGDYEVRRAVGLGVRGLKVGEGIGESGRSVPTMTSEPEDREELGERERSGWVGIGLKEEVSALEGVRVMILLGWVLTWTIVLVVAVMLLVFWAVVAEVVG